MSPVEYLIARNISKIYESLNYSKENINKWYELVKDKIDEDVFEQAKISKNKKLSDKEKQLLHCIHNGVVCLDELISLNDFELYEKTIKEYPISKFEILVLKHL